jgi:hypothetical protein
MIRRVVAVLLLSFLSYVPSALAHGPASAANGGISLMTYNAYIGADISPLLTALTPDELLPAVVAFWQQAQNSNIPFGRRTSRSR